jgi:enoyl-CoA hydratase/carnithine racemase
MSSGTCVSVVQERRRGVLILTLNRPNRLNAWDDGLEDRYFDALEAADADPTLRAVVVTGAGRAFCAGADMEDLESVAAARDGSHVVRRSRPRHYPLGFRKPLIAAVNGAAVGLGLVQALYCDVRFCTPDAKLATIFARRGLIAEYGVAWLLPRLVGTSRALDLLLSGRFVLGEEALRIGLVDHLAAQADLIDAAVAYASDLSENCSPTSMAIIKRQVRDGFECSLSTAIADAERLMLSSFEGDDVREGVASFVERRAPAFAPLRPESLNGF